MEHFTHPGMEYEYLWKSATLKIQKNEKRLLPRILSLLYALSIFFYVRQKTEHEEHRAISKLYTEYTKAYLLYYLLFVKRSQRRKWREKRDWNRTRLAAELSTAECRKCGSTKMKSRMYSTVDKGRVTYVCQQCHQEKRRSRKGERKRERRESRYSSRDRSSSFTGREERTDSRGASQKEPESVREARYVLDLEEEDLTVSKVRERYREAVKEHHPDRGGDVETFIRIQEARDTLENWLRKGKNTV